MSKITPEIILKNIDNHVIELNRNKTRKYLGMSGLGEPCARKVWYTWRWAKKEQFSARILRLFNRGNREEEPLVDLLRGAGYTVHDVDPNTGKQFAFIKHHGHCQGHADGIINMDTEKNPDWWLVEFKTHNNKSFTQLRRSADLKVSKFVHYCQTQSYMNEMKLNNCLYVAVNKDNDSILLLIIKRDKGTIDWLQERQVELLCNNKPPTAIADEPGYWLCNFCIFNALCFSSAKPDKNCRMCKHSRLEEGCNWSCKKKKIKEIPLDEQLKGCSKFKHLQ